MKKSSRWMKVIFSLVLAVALVIPTTAYAAEEKYIDIYVDELFLYVGNESVLGYEVLNGEATSDDWEATWKSGDSNVVSCDENGIFKAVALGTTTLTATTKSGLTDSISVSVIEAPKWNGERTETVIFNNRFSQRQFELTVTETGDYILSADSAFIVEGAIIEEGESVEYFGGMDFECIVSLEAGVTYDLYLYSYKTFGAMELTLEKNTEDSSQGGEDNESGDEIFAEESITISVGDKVYLPALVGTDEDITFASSNEDCVSMEDVLEAIWDNVTQDFDYNVVEADVIAQGQKDGTATITATTESGTDALVINVVEPEEITLGEAFTVELGDGFIGKTYAVTVGEDADYGFMTMTDESKYNEDMYGILYNQAGDIISQNDDRTNDDYDFEIRGNLSAGTYYLYITTYEANEGIWYEHSVFDVQVVADKEIPATGLELTIPSWAYVVEESDVYYILRNVGDGFEVQFTGGNFATMEDVTFTSDNGKVISIDEYDGWYTNEGGTAKITAISDSGLTDTITIKVIEKIVAGDMDLDGIIESADINLIFGVIDGTVEMKDIYYQAEVNGDNKIDEKDIAALITSVELVKKPTKLTYALGEAFDTAGMELKVTFADGNVETITRGFTVSGYDASKEGTQKVTVSYGNETFTFDVVVVKTSPATGDTGATMTWMVVMMLCTGYVVLTFKKRKNFK